MKICDWDFGFYGIGMFENINFDFLFPKLQLGSVGFRVFRLFNNLSEHGTMDISSWTQTSLFKHRSKYGHNEWKQNVLFLYPVNCLEAQNQTGSSENIMFPSPLFHHCWENLSQFHKDYSVLLTSLKTFQRASGTRTMWSPEKQKSATKLWVWTHVAKCRSS